VLGLELDLAVGSHASLPVVSCTAS
jgi:hypothetical protein